ncbi:thiol reductant ABC exporter subunit CydC [Lactobacillus sp. LL6]|uniref:thiol reductant ABC exporter subunit CydC n=1 Tax=Lactobacillus sp. LL6 TaxID=2596827 RepID=UPI001184A6FB|nr:thiol reductant ABC exporter subunit CydC [Lactobacillus sp. LL6]TSO26866.1 thiol reductant ABC exporter subunit CydC [Lactobacillus sp. LL6]
MLNKLPIFRALKQDRWIKPFLKRYRVTLFWAILLGILTYVCGAGLMFCAGFLISKSATMPENILLIYVPIVLTRAFGIARPTVRYFERLVSHNWVFKMTSKLRQKLYDSLEQDAVIFNSKYQLGDILGLLSDDISHIQNLYLRSIFPMMVAWGLYAIIVIALGILSPLMGIWMLIVFGLMIFAIPIWTIIVNGARQAYEKNLQDKLYTDLTDDVMGVTDWVLSGRGQEYLSLHKTNAQKLREVRQKMNKFGRIRDFLFQMLFLLIILSLIIWGWQKFGGAKTPATNWIAAFVLAVFPMVDAFAQLPVAAQETDIYKDSLDRLNDLPIPKKEKTHEINISAPYEIDLKNVHYTYPKTQQAVLNGISLNIKPKEKIAILGKSGAGKSTLASLLRGDFIPQVGSITLNGIEVSEFGDSISDYFSVINQTPYLFNTTIANNLRLGNEEATDTELWQVLRRVGLDKMVDNLPDGLDTEVDEAGLRFSGGERHRLALARILLKDTPIVLLDEPTVGLDPITEQAVIDTFMKELKGKTLIWITHHLQGIDKMDQVIFIENGKIEMQGSPQELWQISSRYRQLKKADQGI